MKDPRECAERLFVEHKGILVLDAEAPELFLETENVEDYVAGVVCAPSLLTQKTEKGKSLYELLASRHILLGVKLDEGTEPMSESPDEYITKGLISLSERIVALRGTYHIGFSTWRSVIKIEGDVLPSAACITENAKRLATYARNVQDAGMVPMVEPEVLLDGAHSRLRAKAVIEETLHALFDALKDQAVDLPSLILKTSMALSGNKSGKTDTPEEVAEDTVSALIASVPADVAGVVFLSGGQTTDQATDNLRAIAKAGKAKGAPWPLSFSYARALQEEGLSIWKGKPENVSAARDAFLARLKRVSKATLGE